MTTQDDFKLRPVLSFAATETRARDWCNIITWCVGWEELQPLLACPYYTRQYYLLVFPLFPEVSLPPASFLSTYVDTVFKNREKVCKFLLVNLQRTMRNLCGCSEYCAWFAWQRAQISRGS